MAILQYKEHDMRKFHIKDQADMYAFFDAVRKGIDQCDRLVKNLVQSNVAKTSVINNLERKLKTPEVTVTTLVDENEEGLIRSAAPQEVQLQIDKDALLEKMRASRETVLQTSEKLQNAKEVLEPISEPKEPVNALTEPQNGQYTLKTFKNGQKRWYFNNSMCKETDVPENIKAQVLGE